MVGEPQVTLIGNLTDDPTLNVVPSGFAVSNFTVASTPRTLNKATNEWEDGDALFIRCTIWRDPAENVAESFRKGDRVIVVGRLRQRSYENKDGQQVTVVECDADEVGASVRFRQVRHSSDKAAARSSEPAGEDPWAAPRDSDSPPF